MNPQSSLVRNHFALRPLCLSLGLLLISTSAWCQETTRRAGRLEFSAGVGLVAPLQRSHIDENGGSAGGEFAFDLSERIALGMTGSFHWLGPFKREADLSPSGRGYDWNNSLVEASLFARLIILNEAGAAPYIKIATGLIDERYQTKRTNPSEVMSSGTTYLTFGGGPGIQFGGRGRMGGFVESLILSRADQPITKYVVIRGGVTLFAR